jgi:hypothetical protein
MAFSGHWWWERLGPIDRLRSRWPGKCAFRVFAATDALSSMSARALNLLPFVHPIGFRVS